MIEKQWRRREEKWRLLALAAQAEQGVGESGRNTGNWEAEAGVTATSEEVGGLPSLVSIIVFVVLYGRALKGQRGFLRGEEIVR